MAYFLTIVITSFLCILEISFLPHFKIFDIVPFLTLAFVSGLAVRYRGIFHLFLALGVGLFFSSLSNTQVWIFPLIFLSTVLMGRFVFYRETGYNATQSFFTLFLSSSGLLYLFILADLMIKKEVTWNNVIFVLVLSTAINIIFGYFIYRIFDKYFDWLNKKAEERYR